jgi:hypothetical protein
VPAEETRSAPPLLFADALLAAAGDLESRGGDGATLLATCKIQSSSTRAVLDSD